MTLYDSVKLTHKINHHSIFQAPNFCLVLFFFNLYFYWYSHFVHTSFSGFYLVVCPCSILLHWASLGQRCFKFLRKTEAWISFRSISEYVFLWMGYVSLFFWTPFEVLLKVRHWKKSPAVPVFATVFIRGLPCSSDGNEICLQCRRPGFSSWGGKILWRRKWQPTPVFLSGESHEQRNLGG